MNQKSGEWDGAFSQRQCALMGSDFHALELMSAGSALSTEKCKISAFILAAIDIKVGNGNFKIKNFVE
jgi:hypothetical protein